MQDSRGKILSVDSRPIRPVGGAIGTSFDLGALRELGIADDDGQLIEEISGRQKITDDGKIVIDLDVDTDDLEISSAGD